MQNYIICEKKGNLPRINVQICEHRCKYSIMCQTFQDYMKDNISEKMAAKPIVGTCEHHSNSQPISLL